MNKGRVIFYSFPSCNASKRVGTWLKLNDVAHVERRILRDRLEPQEIIEILKLTKEGCDDILVNTVQTQQSLREFEDLPLSRFAKYLCDHPLMLKKPILIYGDRLIVGWKKDIYRDIAMNELAG